jgi:hypothetical protein
MVRIGGAHLEWLVRALRRRRHMIA